METMDIRIGKVVGQLGPKSWMQVHDFTPADEKLTTRGRLIAAICLKDSSAAGEIEMVAGGREVLSRLQESYYGSVDASAMEQLQTAINAITTEFQSETVSLEIAAAVIKDQFIYIGVKSAGVWVQQGQKEGWIIDPADQAATVRMVSGRLDATQTLVLGTVDFWQAVPTGMVRAAIETDEESMVETLGGVIHASQRGQSGVGVIIKVTHTTEPVVADVVETVEPEAVVDAAVPFVPRRKFAIADKMQQLLAKLPGKPGPVYLQSTPKTKWRTASMYGGIAFLILLLLLVGAGQIRQNKINQKNSAFNVRLEELMYKYREAQALTELNPARSRELLVGVETEIQQLNELSGKKKDPRLAEIEAGLPAVLGAATGTKVANVDEVIDLELVRSGMRGKVMRLEDGNLVVLDADSARLVVVDPDRKSGKVIVGQEDLGRAKLMATYPTKIEVLTDKGIVECLTADNACKVVVAPDSAWGDLRDMGVFGGNIYLLTDQVIWRHQVTESGFSDKQDWLAETETPDFASASNMTIDGSIWIAVGNGVVKYTRGVKDNFVMEQLDKPLGGVISLYTSEETDKLFILDAANSRVVVINKTGAYDSQYQAAQIKEAVDIEVDVTGANMYLLGGSKIWQIKL